MHTQLAACIKESNVRISHGLVTHNHRCLLSTLRTIPVATDVKHVRIRCLSVVSITMQSSVGVRSGGRLFSHHPSAANKARPFAACSAQSARRRLIVSAPIIGLAAAAVQPMSAGAMVRVNLHTLDHSLACMQWFHAARKISQRVCGVCVEKSVDTPHGSVCCARES